MSPAARLRITLAQGHIESLLRIQMPHPTPAGTIEVSPIRDPPKYHAQ